MKGERVKASVVAVDVLELKLAVDGDSLMWLPGQFTYNTDVDKLSIYARHLPRLRIAHTCSVFAQRPLALTVAGWIPITEDTGVNRT